MPAWRRNWRRVIRGGIRLLPLISKQLSLNRSGGKICHTVFAKDRPFFGGSHAEEQSRGLGMAANGPV
jgi:hypothetical protein